MARPQKEGIDYFSLDVKMNDEAELIEATHGLQGFAILIKMFQKIYSEGYYLKWDEKQQLLFSSKVSSDRNSVVSIVSDCIKWGIFHKGLYEKYGILTSRRIQTQYLTVTYKRVSVEIAKEYLLIDVLDRKNVVLTSISDDRNPDTTPVSVDKSTQSKVKESIYYDDVETTTENPDLKDEKIKNIANLYQQNIGVINHYIAEEIRQLCEYPFELIGEAFKRACINHARNIKYISKILVSWKELNINTLEQLNAYELEQANKKQTKSYKPKDVKPFKTKFHLPESRGDQYTAEELEKLVLNNQKRKQSG